MVEFEHTTSYHVVIALTWGRTGFDGGVRYSGSEQEEAWASLSNDAIKINANENFALAA